MVRDLFIQLADGVPLCPAGKKETGSGMVWCGARPDANSRIEQMPDAGQSVSFMNPEKTCESESESESEFSYHAISFIHR